MFLIAIQLIMSIFIYMIGFIIGMAIIVYVKCNDYSAIGVGSGLLAIEVLLIYFFNKYKIW